MIGRGPRTDPFALGTEAFREGRDRAACPYPLHHFEARDWLAGWDHGAGEAPCPRAARALESAPA